MKLYTVTCDDAATIAAADMAAVAARAESRERANKKAGERHARCERGHERTTSKGGNGQNRKKIVGEVGKNNKRIKRGWKKKEKRGERKRARVWEERDGKRRDEREPKRRRHCRSAIGQCSYNEVHTHTVLAVVRAVLLASMRFSLPPTSSFFQRRGGRQQKKDDGVVVDGNLWRRGGGTHTPKKKLTERETPERASTFPPLFPFNLGSGASALVARTCLMYRPIPLCQLDRPLSLLLPTHTPTLSVCSSERVPLSTLSRRALEERSPRSRLSPTTSKRITY